LARSMLVTGTSRGLGAAVSEAVRSRGDRVFSMSRGRPPARTEKWTKVDFADVHCVGAAVRAMADSLDGPLDGLVLNAALADKSRSMVCGV
jgi:NAD(P)-dependent dehydrogenase (short-subunit alcohol dehydrogenase family)